MIILLQREKLPWGGGTNEPHYARVCVEVTVSNPLPSKVLIWIEKDNSYTKRFFMKAMCPTALIVTYKAMMRRNAGKLMVKLPVRLLVLRPLSLGNLSPHLS